MDWPHIFNYLSGGNSLLESNYILQERLVEGEVATDRRGDMREGGMEGGRERVF